MSASAEWYCWRHLKPFVPFFLICALVAAIYFIINAIVHSGPFTDEHFFDKFDRNPPKPLAFNGTDGG